MAGFVSRQPNGLYCRFSTVTDCPTAWNMTREDYINMKMEEAKEDAEDILDNYLRTRWNEFSNKMMPLKCPYCAEKCEFIRRNKKI